MTANNNCHQCYLPRHKCICRPHRESDFTKAKDPTAGQTSELNAEAPELNPSTKELLQRLSYMAYSLGYGECQTVKLLCDRETFVNLFWEGFEWWPEILRRTAQTRLQCADCNGYLSHVTKPKAGWKCLFCKSSAAKPDAE